MTPQIDRDGKLKMARIGINEASVFPGFCEEHELLFSSFERTKEISEPHDGCLQMFRTVCREIARKRHNLIGLKLSLNEYQEAHETFIRERIAKVDPTIKVYSLKTEGDELEERIAFLLKEGERDLDELETDHYSELLHYIQFGKPEPLLYGLQVPMEFPVALSGLGIVNYLDRQEKLRAIVLIAVLPHGADTLLLLSSSRKHGPITEVLSSNLRDGFSILNTVESWMLHGSDHWFLRPSAWEKIHQKRQDQILESILDETFSIADSPKISIFDDIRKYLITSLEEKLPEDEARANCLKLLEMEKAKLVE